MITVSSEVCSFCRLAADRDRGGGKVNSAAQMYRLLEGFLATLHRKQSLDYLHTPCPPIDTGKKKSIVVNIYCICVCINITTDICNGIFSTLLTSEATFAGISYGHGLDAVWGVGNLISAIFNGDSVRACRVRYV